MTYLDFAEVLQARISADLEAEKLACTSRRNLEQGRTLDARTDNITGMEHIVGIEVPTTHAEMHPEQQQQEVEWAGKQMAELESQAATLQQAIAKGEVVQRQAEQIQKPANRADHLVAELIEMTREFVEMSKQIRDQSTAIDKLRAELENYKRR